MAWRAAEYEGFEVRLLACLGSEVGMGFEDFLHLADWVAFFNGRLRGGRGWKGRGLFTWENLSLFWRCYLLMFQGMGSWRRGDGLVSNIVGALERGIMMGSNEEHCPRRSTEYVWSDILYDTRRLCVR